MLKAAVLAAAECRINELLTLFKNENIQKSWKLIVNSIPESLHIDFYIELIPKPEYDKKKNETSFNKFSELKKDDFVLFTDKLENIIEWSILRCYQIIKYTFDIKRLALPFLISIIKHLGFEIFDEKVYLKLYQGADLFQIYDFISLLYSFHSILLQYCILNGIIKEPKDFIINPLKFISKSPTNRFKLLMSNCSNFSISDLNNILLKYFSTYENLNHINSLNKKLSKKLNQDFHEKCEPFIYKNILLEKFEFIKSLEEKTEDENLDIINIVKINRYQMFEEIVITYLCNEIQNISENFFLNFTKLLISGSKLTKKLNSRFISCPMKLLQIVVFCINGIYSPILNMKALEVQDYVDRIYECLPKSSLIIKQINKPFLISKLTLGNNHCNLNLCNYIRCPFCKKLSFKFIADNSSEEYKEWLNKIYFSIEFYERQQLIIDLLKEFPLKFVYDIRIIELTNIMLSYNLIECFFIRLIKKIPSVYSENIIKVFFSLYEILIDKINLIDSEKFLKVQFFLLESFVFFENKGNENAFIEITKYIFSRTFNYQDFESIFFDVLKRILDEDIIDIRLIENFCLLTKTMITYLEEKGLYDNILLYLKRIEMNLLISKNIIKLLKFKISKKMIDPIFEKISDRELKELENVSIYEMYEFKYKNPINVVLENDKNQIIPELYFSNPHLSLINDNSIIFNHIADILKTIHNNKLRSTIIKFRIITLLIYDEYEEFALKLLIESIEKNSSDICDEVYFIALEIIKKHENCKDRCSKILHFLIKKLQEKIVCFPFRVLNKYLIYKSEPKYDKNYRFNICEVLKNLNNCFSIIHLCKFVNEPTDINYLYNLYFNANYESFGQGKSQNLIEINKVNIADLLIYCYADILLYNGEKSKKILSSANVHFKIKKYICKAILSLISLKELHPKNSELIDFIQRIYQILVFYEKLYKVISNEVNGPQSNTVKSILFKENNIPIYLLSSNSTEWSERWNSLFKLISLDEIIPLVNELDLVHSNNGSKEQIPLIVSLKMFQLVQESNFTLNKKEKYPKISKYHLNIMDRYLIYSTKILIEYYETYINHDNKRIIFIRLLIMITNLLSFKESNETKLEIARFSKGLNSMRKFKELLFFFSFLSNIKPILFDQRFNEQSSISLILNYMSYSYIWDHYWTIFKLIECSLTKESLPHFSYEILYRTFFVENKFPEERYSSLTTKDGRCISYILYDLLKHLLKDSQKTLDFIYEFPTSKRQIEIATILLKIINQHENSEERCKLETELNLLILFGKLAYHFPEFKKKYQKNHFNHYKCVSEFCLDLFLIKNDNHLINDILSSINYDYFQVICDALSDRISNFKIESELDIKELQSFLNDFLNIYFSNNILFSTSKFNFILKILEMIIYEKHPKKNMTFIILTCNMELSKLITIELMLEIFKRTCKNILNVFSYNHNLQYSDCVELYFKNTIKIIKKFNFQKNPRSFALANDLFCEVLYLKILFETYIKSNNFSSIRLNHNSDLYKTCLFKNQDILTNFMYEVFTYIIDSETFTAIELICYWYLFGVSLLNEDHQIKFFDKAIQKKYISLGLISPIKKYKQKALTHFRIEEILANKYFTQKEKSIFDLIDGINIILTGNSFMFLGTCFFSNVIIPLIIYSKININNDFNFFGKYICKRLKIKMLNNFEVSILGVFFKILVIFRKHIIQILVQQLILSKSYKIATEIISMEMNIIKKPYLSVKYSLKNLIKYFEKFCIYDYNSKEFTDEFYMDYISYLLKNQFFILKSNREFFFAEELPKYVFDYLFVKYNSFFSEKNGIHLGKLKKCEVNEDT